ncbi:MAG TPA: NTP transferase domain-containing protein [Clostridiaceae bacterium]|nr:NTP transferase domain-containing protein [Clostridiaceae bacterium]
MKVLILNSGSGSRLKEITKDKPKCLVELYNGETILERQLRLLSKHGFRKFVITTGPFEEKIRGKLKGNFDDLDVTYVQNEKYRETNYIYSMYLAGPQLNDDILLLHGDLVFDEPLIEKISSREVKNVGLIDKDLSLPEKDFKALVVGDRIARISVDLWGDGVFAFMPLYKLERDKFAIWLKEIDVFIRRGNVSVYAEEALNEILQRLHLGYFDYSGHCCREIDTMEDLLEVNEEIRRYDEDEAS